MKLVHDMIFFWILWRLNHRKSEAQISLMCSTEFLKVLSFCVLSWEKEKRSWFFFVIGTDWCWTWWVFFFLVGSSVIFGLIKKIRVWWLTKDWKGANQWIYRSILLGSCLPFSEYLFFDEQIFTFSFYLVSFASFRWLNLKLWGYPFW